MKTLTLAEVNEIMERNGGFLDLSGTGITSLPDNLTVGGSLYLLGTRIKDKVKERRKVKILKDGDYVPGRYLYADNILTHVRKKEKAGEYTIYVGKIKGKNIVSDGKHYSAGIRSYMPFVGSMENGSGLCRNAIGSSPLSLMLCGPAT